MKSQTKTIIWSLIFACIAIFVITTLFNDTQQEVNEAFYNISDPNCIEFAYYTGLEKIFIAKNDETMLDFNMNKASFDVLKEQQEEKGWTFIFNIVTSSPDGETYKQVCWIGIKPTPPKE